MSTFVSKAVLTHQISSTESNAARKWAISNPTTPTSSFGILQRSNIPLCPQIVQVTVNTFIPENFRTVISDAFPRDVSASLVSKGSRTGLPYSESTAASTPTLWTLFTVARDISVSALTGFKGLDHFYRSSHSYVFSQLPPRQETVVGLSQP